MGIDTLIPGPRPLPEIGHRKIGPDTYRFCLWAPRADTVELERIAPLAGKELSRLAPGGEAGWETPWTVTGRLAMARLGDGYWLAEDNGLASGDLYRFRLDGERSRPDPASQHQPHGVHGPSALVDHGSHQWRDAGFTPPALSELILYEMHVGVFTPEGTLPAAGQRLDDVAALGVTAVQVMPVGQFPGRRNWGYDSVYPFSVHHAYGGPEGLKLFVEACHARGLAVVLDVVYNHLGPEGNYLRDFGPYFTTSHKTPWGDALNYDGPDSDHVRHFFFHSVLHWLDHYHVDGFRLDATHAIFDQSPRPFLGELAELARRYAARHGHRPYLVAESNLNDPRLVLPPDRGGLGLSGIYNEDFHHGLHAWLTGERHGYYADYGRMEHLAAAATQGFAYSGQYSAYHRRGHGADSARLPACALTVFLQNHDQTGNRAHGERLAALIEFEANKAAAGLLLLGPFLPLLFMGEEYGEDHPFLYFISHHDPDLIQAVRTGRLEEFAGLGDGRHPPPDPQDERTFQHSKLHWEKRTTGRHGLLRDWYEELIRQRKRLGLTRAGNGHPRALRADEQGLLVLEGTYGARLLVCLFNFSAAPLRVATDRLGLEAGPGRASAHAQPTGSGPTGTVGREAPAGSWHRLLDSSEVRWGGPGATMPLVLIGEALLPPWSMAAYVRKEFRP